MGVAQGLELVRCAQINFENVVKTNPMLAHHPLWKMAAMQLEEGIKELGKGGD